MKKWGIAIAFIVILIIAIFVGKSMYNANNNNKITKEQKNSENQIKNEVDYSVKNDITINVSSEEEKISPNATLILKKHYKECGHTIKDYAEIPEELVNLTKKELAEQYKDWNIEKFTPLDITLIKEEEGMCNEHYILKQKEGVIAIYEITQDGKQVLKETTGISIEYLTQSDKLEIEKGIEVYTKERLNSIIEDYE